MKTSSLPEPSSLLDFWFRHEDYWFANSPQKDQEICDQFQHLLQPPEFYQEALKQKTHPREALHRIILLDQITRHIDRHINQKINQKQNLKQKPTSMATLYHPMALATTLSLLDTPEIISGFTPAERVFILLPLRHDPDNKRVWQALHQVETFRQEDPSNRYYRRFYQATVRSLAQRILPRCVVTVDNLSQVVTSQPTLLTDFKMDALRSSHPAQTHQTQLNRQTQLTCPTQLTRQTSIIISLSGGVDSMVASYHLKHLGYRVVALHINYSNRDTCSEEIVFLENWCRQLGIELWVRDILEIKRSRDDQRRFYEEITKTIRFASYRWLVNQMGEDCLGVVLGHNQDDSVENIITNIAKKRNYDNLLGMREKSEMLGVVIWRPMLTITKSKIVEFADKHQIPSLPDSTPSWSDRGRLRDECIPFLQSFHPGIVPGLLEMATSYREMSQTYMRMLQERTDIQQENKEGTYSRIVIYFQDCWDIAYWKMIFQMCRDRFRIPMPSHKSIQNVIRHHQRIGQRLVLMPNHYLVFETKNRCFIF